jgi:phage-related protein
MIYLRGSQMEKHYPVIFFVDQKDSNPVAEYMFSDKGEKDLDIIINVIKRLHRVGLVLLRTNMAKDLDNGLFELRKDMHRILFAQYEPNCFILLHAFRKETKKTPLQHLVRGRKNLKGFFAYRKFEEIYIPIDF